MPPKGSRSRKTPSTGPAHGKGDFLNQIWGSRSSNFFLENSLKQVGSNRNVSQSFKATIPPPGVSQPRQGKEALAPARVQPSRINKSNRMADIMANLEDDDDSRSAVPHRKKRQIIETDPEDNFSVPDEIEHNPMAPAKKKRRQLKITVENPPCVIPSLLPLKPTSPAQVPPNFQGKRPKSHKETLPQHQSHPPAQYLPSGIPDEDDPMTTEQG